MLAEDDISKKLDLEPNIVLQAMNIHTKICEWHWLWSEYQRKTGGLPPTKDIERWKLHGPHSDDLPNEQEKSSIELLGKRKAAPKLSKDEVLTSQAREVSLLRKKCRVPSIVIKSSSKEILPT